MTCGDRFTERDGLGPTGELAVGIIFVLQFREYIYIFL